jgi:uncharacterized protein YqfB (UPF0267 family)
MTGAAAAAGTGEGAGTRRAEEVAGEVLEVVPSDANTEFCGVAVVAVDEEEPTLTFKLLLEEHATENTLEKAGTLAELAV